MKARHNSSDVEYRRPFGAVALGDEVTLSLGVANVSAANVSLEPGPKAAERIFAQCMPSSRMGSCPPARCAIRLR